MEAKTNKSQASGSCLLDCIGYIILQRTWTFLHVSSQSLLPWISLPQVPSWVYRIPLESANERLYVNIHDITT